MMKNKPADCRDVFDGLLNDTVGTKQGSVFDEHFQDEGVLRLFR